MRRGMLSKNEFVKQKRYLSMAQPPKLGQDKKDDKQNDRGAVNEAIIVQIKNGCVAMRCGWGSVEKKLKKNIYYYFIIF